MVESNFNIDLNRLREDINLGSIQAVNTRTAMSLVDRIEQLEYELEQEKVISRSFSEMVKLLKHGGKL